MSFEPHAGPLVSIVVPTYNRLELLREAVASVKAQTHASWELVVVDDGSSDGTAHWVAGLADARIRLVALPHGGNLGALRNRGVVESRGKWIAFLDSDDVFEPDKLAVQQAALDSHPEAGWSYTAVTRVDRDGAELGPDPRVRAWRELSGWILPQVLRFDALLATPTVMVRRELLERVGPFDETLPESQDYELFFRLAAAAPAVAVSEPLTRVRIHAGSMSTDRLRVHEAWILIYERLASASSDPAIRRICADEARHHRIAAASRRGRRRQPVRALGHLLPVLFGSPWSPRVWRALAGVAVHTVVGDSLAAADPALGKAPR